MTKTASTDLVAAELLPALALFPKLEFIAGEPPRRDGFDDRPAMPISAELSAVSREEHMIPASIPGEPDVRVLVYTPLTTIALPRPAVLHIHGGGYVLGTADINDMSNRATALDQDCVVVSVDYRLAPETRWPHSLHDCHAGLMWMHRQAEALHIDPARIAIAGESAGGGHAVALALFARDRARIDPGAPRPCFVLVDAPMLDDRTGADPEAEPHPHCGHHVWTPTMNRYGWSSLLGVPAGSDKVPRAAVPARATDLSGLPPHCITVGALDLFLEEDLEWVRRLGRAGVPVEFHVVPGAFHGFGAAASAPQTQQLVALRRTALARALSASSA